MKILVDAMGGDNAPLCVLQGASQAAAEFGDGMTLALLGEEKAIRDCAAENKIDLAPFEYRSQCINTQKLTYNCCVYQRICLL